VNATSIQGCSWRDQHNTVATVSDIKTESSFANLLSEINRVAIASGLNLSQSKNGCTGLNTDPTTLAFANRRGIRTLSPTKLTKLLPPLGYHCQLQQIPPRLPQSVTPLNEYRVGDHVRLCFYPVIWKKSTTDTYGMHMQLSIYIPFNVWTPRPPSLPSHSMTVIAVDKRTWYPTL
jgi:hypothetical protein